MFLKLSDFLLMYIIVNKSFDIIYVIIYEIYYYIYLVNYINIK